MTQGSSLAEWSGLARSLAIYHGMPWRRRALRRFYAELVPADSLVFDIGAHVGNRTLALAALGCRCIALEPQPLFARFLTRLFRGKTSITLVVAAAARQTGVARLRVSRRHPTVSTLSSDWIDTVGSTAGFEKVQWDHTVEVPVTTLDRLIAEYGLPSFCKIDVEGLEAEILAGVSEPIPLVAVEYVPAAMHVVRACINRLQSLGQYEYNHSAGESHALALPAWTDASGIVEVLEQATINGASGDLYARLLEQGDRDA